MWGYIGFTPSVRQSVRLCIPHAMSALWLVAYFHKCYRSVYAPSMLVVLVRRNEELISDCRSFPGDGYKPCLTTLTHLGRPQWLVVCIRLMPVAILEQISIHMTCVRCAGLVQGMNCVLQKTTVSHVHHGMISPGTCLKLTHWTLEDLNEIWMSNFQANRSDW